MKFRRLFFCIVLLPLICSNVVAQASFNERINVGVIFEITSMVRMYDGGYLLGGTSSTIENFSETTPTIMAMDAGGNIRWVKPVTGGGHGWVLSMDRSSDGAYFASGSYATIPSQSFILKFDTTGKILWSRLVINNDPDQYIAFTASNDGGCFITEQSNPNGDLFAMKFSGSGTLDWSKTLSGQGYEMDAATHLADGSFVATGFTSHIPRAIVLCKWFSSGVLSWLKQFTAPGDVSISTGLAITATHDGGFAVCGQTDGDFGGDAFIAKFDSSGSPLWNNAIDLFTAETGQAITETSDGKLLVAGNTVAQDFRDSSGSIADNAFVLGFKSDGSLETIQVLQIPQSRLGINAVVSDPDGSVVIAGVIQDSSEQGLVSGAIVTKIIPAGANCHMKNSLASVKPVTNTIITPQLQFSTMKADTIALQLGDNLPSGMIDLCTFSDVPDVINHGSGMLIFPNPVPEGSAITIEYAGLLQPGSYEYSILDLLGNTIKKETVNLAGGKMSVVIDVSEFPAGVYIADIRSKNSYKMVGRMKFIKE